MPGAAGNGQTRIVLKDLTKIYGGGGQEVPAVDTVSVEVHEGEFVALIGPSGCGKSTILNMVAGLIPISSGDILIDDKPVITGTPTPKVGYVFQRDTVFPWRTVQRNIGYGLELSGMDRAEREARVNDMVNRAGLGGFEDAFPLTLSGGMRQRVALMRTVIMRPEVLLMDEPFGALDEITRDHLNEQLLGLWRETGKTVVFVTHSIPEAVFLSTRIVVMSPRPGRIIDVIECDLPADRTLDARETLEFQKIAHRVRDGLRAGHSYDD